MVHVIIGGGLSGSSTAVHLMASGKCLSRDVHLSSDKVGGV
jgi:glycine/D-amino acid oxidase-like deaminating enzyme